MSTPHAHGLPIQRHDQLEALRSPLRQEIMDAIAAAGPMTVADVARVLDRAPDSLYYHVRHLARVDLLESADRRRPGKRTEMVFDVPGRPLHIPPRPGVAAYRRSLRAIVASMLSLARRQHAAALNDGGARFDGPQRDLWASRVTGWMTPEDVKEVNRALAAVRARFSHRRGWKEGRFLAFTFVLTPVVPTARRASRELSPVRSSKRRKSSR